MKFWYEHDKECEPSRGRCIFRPATDEAVLEEAARIVVAGGDQARCRFIQKIQPARKESTRDRIQRKVIGLMLLLAITGAMIALLLSGGLG